MSDDVGRRGRRDNDDDFGPPLFADDLSATGDSTSQMDPSDSLSFGDSDTGPLPHWTSPPTGEMPTTLITGNHPVQDPTDDLDVWSSFSRDAPPVWSDDPLPTGQMETSPAGPAPDMFDDELADPSVPVAPRGPSRITIGTDPTDERMGRPMPKTRSRSGRVDPSRGTQRPGRPGPVTTATARTASAPSNRDMPTAVAVGLAIAAVFIGALLWKPWAVLIIIVVVVALAAVEFFDKATEKGYRPATIAGIAACVALPLATYWVGETAIPLVIVFALAAACLTFVTSSGIESSPLPNSAITMLGVVWIGVLGSFAALILAWSNTAGLGSVGTDTLFLLALGVVANDVGALFVGSVTGRTPLRAWISPNKTVEGFVGGAFMTIIAMVVVGALDKSDTWTSYRDLILLGVVVAVAAPLGDLTESMFKRNLEIKDFGSIVKGHGGVLDRFDGFLFTLPAVYYLTLVITPWLP
ncbi:MAG: phosphatidate cytidylyltransferase [Ilumatobacteraceae bacterium]